MGNRETATDSRGTTNLAYDNRNRLETLTYPDGRKLTYGYDANGNRTSLTAEVGGETLTTTYSYDELNRLQTVTDSEGRDYVHEYDPNGNRAKLTYPNNTATSYVYDDLNRLTHLTTVNTATLGMIQSYQYTLGAAGNRERIDENEGTSRASRTTTCTGWRRIRSATQWGSSTRRASSTTPWGTARARRPREREL